MRTRPTLNTPNTLSTYVTNFSQSWETNKNRLTAVYHYNFAEILVEKSNLKKAIAYFTKSYQFYTRAAEKSDDLCNKELLQSAEQTIARIKEIEALNEDKNPNDALNKLTMSLQPKRKRELNEESTYCETKKIKKDPSLIANPKKTRWETECTQLLNEFKQIGIEKYNFSVPFREDKLSRYKASLASNFALDIIEKLSFPNKNLSDTEKQCRLKEVQKGFSTSIDFYSQVGLVNEKEKIIRCNNLLISTAERFNTPLRKITTKNSNSLTKIKPSFDKQIISNGKLDLPIRYTRAFFKNLSPPENNATVDKQSSLDDERGYFP